MSEENPYDFLQITSNNVKEYEEQISDFSESKITLHRKLAKHVYSNQDFYNICRNMKNNEIAGTLLKKLVALKVHLFNPFIYMFNCRFQLGSNCVYSD